MAESLLATRTTTKLLDALHDLNNEPVWTQLDARYRPVLCGLARRLGLNASDAEEVAQQTLAEFVRAYRDGRYDRTKGRLSSWILGIAQNSALRMLRNSRRQHPSGAAAHEPAEQDLRELWDEERDRAILDQALGMLRDESAVDDRTLLAFELFALRGLSAGETADRCGMTADQVYVAKSRVTKRLRQLVEELTRAFEEDR